MGLERTTSAVGLFRPPLAKIKALTDAAKRNPKCYQPLVKEMDRISKVDCVSKQLSRMKAK